jgi:hypothetical protein
MHGARLCLKRLLGVGLLFLVILSARLWGCPFCEALSKSFREELSLADHAVIAVCEQPAREGDAFAIHAFRVERNFLGGEFQPETILQTYSRRPYQAGDKVLLLGFGKSPHLEWSPSEPLGPLAIDYIAQVVEGYHRDQLRFATSHANSSKQSGEGSENAATEAARAHEVEWLNLFWTHLESEEAWVRRDCFNAVAQASVRDMRAWAKQLDADEVIRRLEAKNVAIEHRRFYWTVLSLCGRTEDAQFARKQIFQYVDHDSQRLDGDPIGLDAAISCLVLLAGETALEEVEQKILSNPQQLYSTRYAAIVALRVHAVEFQAIETKRLAAAFSLALRESAIADLVIPDLARMEDWSHIERLLELYRDAGQTQQYLRVPIVNYLRACPLPEAEAALDVCRQVDPDAYRRASIIFPKIPASSLKPEN